MTTASPAAPPAAVPESRALTGLRGAGALLVMLHHASLHLGLDARMPALGAVLRKGYLGVDLFFVLSGFVMCMVYGGWFTGRSASANPDAAHPQVVQPQTVHSQPIHPLAAVAVFLVRRVARLWPLHAVVLGVLLAAGALLGSPGHSARLILANVAMVQAWGVSAAINPPAWSVSTEFLAYLLFPLLARPVLCSRAGPAVAALAIAAALAICLALAPPLGPGRRGLLDIYFNNSPLPALRCLAGFMLGMLAWRAGLAPAVRGMARRAWAAPAALALALAAAGVNDLLALALMPLVVLGAHHGRGLACRLLATQPLHGIGTLSYAAYLIHYALLFPLPPGAAPVLTVLVLYTATTFLLALIAHYAAEVPTRRLVRWLGDTFLAAARLRPSTLPRRLPPTPRS